MTSRRILSVLALVCLVPWTSPAAAQSDRERARQHFERALSLFDEQRYEAALIEFEAAYRAVPHPSVLYNIGNVHAALGHSVEAVDAYERYLREMESIDPDRRAEVEGALALHRARIGRVHVRVNIDGAVVRVDDEDVGTSPLSAPLRLTVGSHLISARAPGYDQPQTRVDVAGNAETTVELTLREAQRTRGTLRVTTVPEGVTVLVAGREVGLSPLEETLPLEPGEVTVTGRRLGYVDATERVQIEDGAEASVRLALEPDVNAPPEHLGTLRLRVPDEETELLVDGRAVALRDGRVELPVGPHDVRLTVADRQPIRARVEVPSAAESVFAPELRWTEDARRDQIGGADAQRTVGWVVGGLGLAAVAGSVGLLAWNEPLFDEYQSLQPQFTGPDGCRTRGLDCSIEVGEAEEDRFMQLERMPLEQVRATWIAGMVIGVGAVGVGLALLLTAPSTEAIDAAANVRASLRVGPGGIGIEGAF